jgi:hypothetical protein
MKTHKVFDALTCPLHSQAGNRKDKLNASILVREEINSVLVHQQINYVAVTVKDRPFPRRALIVCLYLYPHSD